MFDDLDADDEAVPDDPDRRRDELLRMAVPESDPFPFARYKNLGPHGKMKMLFLHGGGTNQKVARQQIGNTFSPARHLLHWDVFEGPHEVPLTWHHNDLVRMSLAAFGPKYYTYHDRVPYANAQGEDWHGIDATIDMLKAHFKTNGPYDGVCGFDVGGEVLVQIAALAQNGAPGLAGMFRFMVLLSSGTARAGPPMARLGRRPAAPLDIPAVHCWSRLDQVHPDTRFEETALLWQERAREVILHDQGHQPPLLLPGMPETQRLMDFLDTMDTGAKWAPSDNPDNAFFQGLWLPLNRVAPPKISALAPKRLLVVQDPLGSGRLKGRLKEMAWAMEKGNDTFTGFDTEPFQRAGVSSPVEDMRMLVSVLELGPEDFLDAAPNTLSVLSVKYSEGHKAREWHPDAKNLPSMRYLSRDIVYGDHHDDTAHKVAVDVMDGFSLGLGERIGIVGIGTGAYIALAIAKYFISGWKTVPGGLWVVDPPSILPAASVKPCALIDCPVRCLTHRASSVGPMWRWELLTCGPFSQGTFGDANELVDKVVKEYMDL